MISHKLFPFVAIGALVGCSTSRPAGVQDTANTPGDAEVDADIDAGDPAEPDAGSDAALRPPVKITTPAKQAAEQSDVDAALAGVRNLSAATFATKYAVPFATSLAYDPKVAKGLDLIQASSQKLTDAELASYASHGFVISNGKRFPTFAHGYETIYAADLPLYVSADSILEAVHRSYDELLGSLERTTLTNALRAMLGAMRSALVTAPADQASADADVYLATALSLLDNKVSGPVRGGDMELIVELFNKATTHTGTSLVTLFGVPRKEDFSQYTPRGHYADSPVLERYFQSMMWLGRTDFRFLETQSDGSQVFNRRQVEAALRLRDLLDTSSRANWSLIDATIQAFVGMADYMTVPQLDSLLKDLGVTATAELSAVPDDRIAQAIVDGRYGTQRISSHIMINGLGTKTLPLSSSFAFMGQRYVIDSHVLSNVVYDRVLHTSLPARLMPDPLDVAFAALGNNQAGALLNDQLEKFGYAPDLASMRVLVDYEGADSWTSNLYTSWLSANRALSPTAELSNPAMAGLSSIFTTEAWGRRLLNAQLASWAELRHDTVLYAKQSYTGGVTCEFPDAYVDPYPKFYEALRAFADRGAELVGFLAKTDPTFTASAQAYFAKLSSVMQMLGKMAEAERSGTPFTTEQMAFINQAVHLQPAGCNGEHSFDGWYAQLYRSVVAGAEYDPTITDVHTQPTDEGGSPVGRVLHVGTGMPRLMVVSVDTCQGPRAYAGLASSYFEVVTQNYQRLTDMTWASTLNAQVPDDVRWMKDLVVR